LVGVDVGVAVGVFVGVDVGVRVGVFVGVAVGVIVGVGVAVGVLVEVGVGVGTQLVFQGTPGIWVMVTFRVCAPVPPGSAPYESADVQAVPLAPPLNVLLEGVPET
jgi:hypothetical protein